MAVQMVVFMTIAKRIKEIKLTLRLTSAELAEKLDIPSRTIGSYERAEAQPSPKFLIALYENLNIDINWLLSGRGNMFIDKSNIVDSSTMSNLKDRLHFTNEQIAALFDLLGTSAGRDMLLKLLEVKKGNRDSLDSLIQNLQGIKAILG